jgi:flagellar L-ring protein FlgH
MKAFNRRHHLYSARTLMLGLLCVPIGMAWLMHPPKAHSESLYRASAQYDAVGKAPLTSRSLFTPPIARQVGDIVIIQIDETSQLDSKSELKITRNQAVNENGTSLVNQTIGFVLDKLPFRTGGLKNTLSAPSFNGMSNTNNLNSKAESTRSNNFKENVACQVVQLLPNGDLMVQGEKVVMYNKERQNLMVTGIIRPYYLDSRNQISSKMVGGFQMVQGGKGVISRQQNDSLANKVYQFFN